MASKSNDEQELPQTNSDSEQVVQHLEAALECMYCLAYKEAYD